MPASSGRCVSAPRTGSAAAVDRSVCAVGRPLSLSCRGDAEDEHGDGEGGQRCGDAFRVMDAEVADDGAGEVGDKACGGRDVERCEPEADQDADSSPTIPTRHGPRPSHTCPTAGSRTTARCSRELAAALRARFAGMPVTDLYFWADYPGLPDEAVDQNIAATVTQVVPLLV